MSVALRLYTNLGFLTFLYMIYARVVLVCVIPEMTGRIHPFLRGWCRAATTCCPLDTLARSLDTTQEDLSSHFGVAQVVTVCYSEGGEKRCQMKTRFIVYIDCNPTVHYSILAQALETIIEDNAGGVYFNEETVKVNTFPTKKKKPRGQSAKI